jgi:hypothetical protein
MPASRPTSDTCTTCARAAQQGPTPARLRSLEADRRHLPKMVRLDGGWSSIGSLIRAGDYTVPVGGGR